MKRDLQPFVDRLTSHSRLTKDERNALLALPSESSQVQTHRDVVPLGHYVTHVSVVLDGTVARFGQNADGERQIIALHIPGDAPDLHLVVVPKATAPLQALSPTSIARVPHDALRELAAEYPAIAEAFWRQCSLDAGITAQWVVNLGRRDTKTRIAHLLCEMAVRYDVSASSGEVTFPLPLTHTHLSDATGVTPVHVSRTIKTLKEEGLAMFTERTVRIPNWNRLVRCAEFDPSYLQSGLRAGENMRVVD